MAFLSAITVISVTEINELQAVGGCQNPWLILH